MTSINLDSKETGMKESFTVAWTLRRAVTQSSFYFIYEPYKRENGNSEVTRW